MYHTKSNNKERLSLKMKTNFYKVMILTRIYWSHCKCTGSHSSKSCWIRRILNIGAILCYSISTCTLPEIEKCNFCKYFQMPSKPQGISKVGQSFGLFVYPIYSNKGSLAFLGTPNGSLGFFRVPSGSLGFLRFPQVSLGLLRFPQSSIGFLRVI